MKSASKIVETSHGILLMGSGWGWWWLPHEWFTFNSDAIQCWNDLMEFKLEWMDGFKLERTRFRIKLGQNDYKWIKNKPFASKREWKNSVNCRFIQSLTLSFFIPYVWTKENLQKNYSLYCYVNFNCISLEGYETHGCEWEDKFVFMYVFIQLVCISSRER